MAPMKHESNSNCSSNYGEVVARQVNVLASCYIVDPSASLKGLHYCTTGAAGKKSPLCPSHPITLIAVITAIMSHQEPSRPS